MAGIDWPPNAAPSLSDISGWTCTRCGGWIWNNATHDCPMSNVRIGAPPISVGTLPIYPTCAGLQRDHEYAVFDRKRLFCRHCGSTKEV